jgi:hypothetical protein
MLKKIKVELDRLLHFERVAIDSIAYDDLDELELKFVVEKLFEVSNMILRLEIILQEEE